MNSAIEKLEAWMKKNNQSAIDVANGIGVTKQAVYLCLNGTNKFSKKMAELISRYTNGDISTNDLLYPNEDRESRQTPSPDIGFYERVAEVRPARKITTMIDGDIANALESIVFWTSGRKTIRGEIEAALRAHITVMELLELHLVNPITRQVIVKRSGEKFPPPIYVEPIETK